MSDQADNLRLLVQTAGAGCAKPQAVGLPLVVVTGAKGDVGATTVAVNVAAVLADRGRRVLLVDAAERASNMAEIAGVRSATANTLADVVADRCRLGEAVAKGQLGVNVLRVDRARSARKETAPRNDTSVCVQKHLLAYLQKLRNAVDVFVVDTGAGLSQSAQRLWLRARMVLLVSTEQDAAMMDAYAAFKLHVNGAQDADGANVRVLVNQSENERMAQSAIERFSSCCRKFLKCEVASLSPLPRHGEDASDGIWPRVWESPNSPFGHAVMWLGRAVEDAMEVGSGRDVEQQQNLRASA